jgi:hypothetical protein
MPGYGSEVSFVFSCLSRIALRNLLCRSLKEG